MLLVRRQDTVDLKKLKAPTHTRQNLVDYWH
jgi:hypothetical protein